jgi:hypothetical protein
LRFEIYSRFANGTGSSAKSWLSRYAASDRGRYRKRYLGYVIGAFIEIAPPLPRASLTRAMAMIGFLLACASANTGVAGRL